MGLLYPFLQYKRLLSLVRRTPRGNVRPRLQSIFGPLRSPVHMTLIASVGDLERLRGCRRDEFESVGPDIHVGDRLLNLWHMTSDTFITGAAGRMVRMRLYRRPVRPNWQIRAVASKAENVRGRHKVRIIVRTVDIMTSEALHAVKIHLAGDEVVALHPILVSGSVGKMRE